MKSSAFLQQQCGNTEYKPSLTLKQKWPESLL